MKKTNKKKDKEEKKVLKEKKINKEKEDLEVKLEDSEIIYGLVGGVPDDE